MKVPFVYFVFFLIAGILCGYFITVSPFCYRLITVLWGTGIIVCSTLILRKELSFQGRNTCGISFAAVLFCWGWLSLWRNHPKLDRQHFSHHRSTVVAGYLEEDPIRKENHIRFTLQVKAVREKSGAWAAADGRLLVNIYLAKSTSLYLGYGDEVLIQGCPDEIPPRFNPYGFDYKQYLIKQGIWQQLYARGEQLQRTGRSSGNVLLYKLWNWRKKMVRKFQDAIRNTEANTLLSTLVLGYRVSVDQDLTDIYATTGTIHILSVSGMHVAVIFACLAFFLRWMEYHPILAIGRYILLLISIWFYVLLSGLSPSALRAGFMISLVITGTSFKRQGNPLNQLAASAFFLLLYRPTYLLDLGFQLSYLAVIGLLWGTSRRSLIKKKPKCLIREWLTNYAILSCAAQLTTAPLVLYYFHSFSVYFLLANLLIAIPVDCILYGGTLLLVLPRSTIALYVAKILEWLIVRTNSCLQHIAEWPFAKLQGVWVGTVECLLLYLVLFLFFLAFRGRPQKKYLYAGLISMLLLGLLLDIRKYRLCHEDKFIVFNVKKDVAVGIIRAGIPIVYSNITDLNAPTIQYQVMPTIEAMADVHRLTYFSREVCGIRFKEKTLAILDPKAKGCALDSEVDLLLIRNNPAADLLPVNMVQKRGLLWIIDGSNNDQTINKIKQKAQSANIAYYILKDNFAYVWHHN